MAYIQVECPNCGSIDIQKNGKDEKREQRYLCKNPNCSKKTFLGKYTYKGCLSETKTKILKITFNGFVALLPFTLYYSNSLLKSKTVTQNL